MTHRARSVALAVAAAVLLAGCASLPPENRRSYTTGLAVQGPTTPLDRVAAASLVGAGPGESGARLLLGPSGLEVRLALIRSARRSVDLQSYHLHDDTTGLLVLRELRDAATRGVRVRLLLDDLYTDGLEPLLVGLGAHPNAEVRLFNPFPTRGSVRGRFSRALLDASRLQRRMHNKLFLADGVFAVTGGRNLGDAYFLRSRSANFFDHDALIAGPVVPQMVSLFDEYWNADQVRPASAVLESDAAPEERRRGLDTRLDRVAAWGPAPSGGPDRLGWAPVLGELSAGRVRLHHGRAQAFADSPAKAWGAFETARLPSGALVDNARWLLMNEFRTARSDVRILSPYLVPGAAMLESVRANLERGVRVSLLTNSLAATDEPVVHTGYRRHRPHLLRAGVEIHEFDPALGQRLLRPGDIATRSLSLHTKAVVIDRESV